MIEPPDNLFQAIALERKLFHRQQQQLFERLRGPLVRSVEFANGFDSVAIELQPQWAAIPRRKNIDDAAPRAKVAAFFHKRDVLKTPLDEMIEQRFTRQILASDQIKIGLLECFFPDHPLHQRRRRRHENRRRLFDQLVKTFETTSDVVWMGRELLERQNLPR